MPAVGQEGDTLPGMDVVLGKQPSRPAGFLGLGPGLGVFLHFRARDPQFHSQQLIVGQSSTMEGADWGFTSLDSWLYSPASLYLCLETL